MDKKTRQNPERPVFHSRRELRAYRERLRRERRRQVLIRIGLLIAAFFLLMGASALFFSQVAEKQRSRQDYESLIYAYMRKELGYTNAMASGIMANLESESKFDPSNLQDSCEKRIGMSDAEYTEAVDKGRYSAEEFENDSAGYGLCQWTYHSRKEGLYNLAKERGVSISDYRMQLDFLNKELGSKKIEYMMALPDDEDGAYEAGRYFCAEFEKPQNSNAPKTRGKSAREYYQAYAALYPD